MEKTIVKKTLIQKSQTRAEFDISSVDKENRTIDLVWTTGFKGLRTTRSGFQYYEELEVSREAINTSRLVGNPLLAAHDTTSLDSVIGVIEDVRIDPILKEGRSRVRFANDDFSDRVFQKVQDKILRNTSVGYNIDEFVDATNKGDVIPTYRVKRWTPLEISLVPIGFDPGAQIRAQENETEIEINTNLKEIENFRSENIKENIMKNPEILAEKLRVLEIRDAVRAAKLDESFAEELISQNLTTDEARKKVLEKLSAAQTKVSDNTVRVEIGTENLNARMQGVEDAISQRINPTEFKVTELSRSYFDRTLMEMFESIIPRHMMESKIAYAQRVMSSSDLPKLLASSANKNLQKEYELAPKSFESWCSRGNLKDYKEQSQIKLSNYPSLEEITEGGEYVHGAISEENEVAQLKKYGKIIAFTDVMLVNDDLKALQRFSSQQGIAAARLENKKAYAGLTTNKTMKDNVALYHASHGNLGSTAAISETTIGEAFKLMMKQQSVDSLDYLQLVPKFLICGPDKMVEAKKALAAISATQVSNVNPFSGELQLIVDPEISGNQYYFVADPNVVDTVTAFRMEGQELPVIKMKEDFNTDSILLKVTHNFEAQPMDWRGLLKNAGA